MRLLERFLWHTSPVLFAVSLLKEIIDFFIIVLLSPSLLKRISDLGLCP